MQNMNNYSLDHMIFSPEVTFYMTLHPEKLPKFYDPGLNISHMSYAGFLHLLCQKLSMDVDVMESVWCHVAFLTSSHPSWGQGLNLVLSTSLSSTQKAVGQWQGAGGSVGLRPTALPESHLQPKRSRKQWHRCNSWNGTGRSELFWGRKKALCLQCVEEQSESEHRELR